MRDRFLVATRKGLFTVEGHGSGAARRWEIVKVDFLGCSVTMALADGRDGACYAALALGHFGAKLHRSDDGGATWQERAVPVYPPQPDDYAAVKPTFEGPPAPWTLVQIWALEAGGRDKTGSLWAGTIPGGLFRSLDGGLSWEMLRSLWDRPERLKWFGGGYDYPGIHSICVDPRDSRHVTVGVSCGGVWTTLDGGVSWQCRAKGMWAEYMPPEQREDPDIQDPHRLVQCASSPDVFWVQHHNGVFRSTNGAASWHEVLGAQPSAFGFAMAVHPQDPNTAWRVPAAADECRVPVEGQTVVTRTRDGGRSFEILRNGLPQKHSYHLVYRHGLDVDSGGERLVLGSTTGGLWVSEDQGDSWQGVSSSLPPIYCVRFVPQKQK